MKTMPLLRSLVFATLALHAAASQACRVAPASQLIPPAEQLAAATEVALGQVIGATPLSDYQVEYRFVVLEQLAGAPQKVMTEIGGPVGRNDPDTTFHDHRDFAFWARGGGRATNGTDCVLHPGFVVGSIYLVFPGPPPTRRSFEKIEMVDGRPNPDDKWLATVRQTLAGAATTTAASRDATPDYERVGRFLYGYQRLVAQADLDPKSLAAQHAPADLQLRARRLTDEFDRIVQGGVRAPDAHLDATLREAAEVSAALAAWRNSANH
jgi:hypothetical protein